MKRRAVSEGKPLPVLLRSQNRSLAIIDISHLFVGFGRDLDLILLGSKLPTLKLDSVRGLTDPGLAFCYSRIHHSAKP
jgi:hypothetical protein